jgi:hypothetical protein
MEKEKIVENIFVQPFIAPFYPVTYTLQIIPPFFLWRGMFINETFGKEEHSQRNMQAQVDSGCYFIRMLLYFMVKN